MQATQQILAWCQILSLEQETRAGGKNAYQKNSMTKLSRLPLGALRGVIHVSSSEPDGDISIDGDAAGLRSLARLLEALADLDLTKIDMPTSAREHIHLLPGQHLDRKSARLILGRADFASGKIDRVLFAGTPKGVRAVREFRAFNQE